MTIKSQLESLLFVSAKPLAISELANLIEVPASDIEETLTLLAEEYKEQGRGFILIQNNGQYQLTTSSDNAELVTKFLRDETSGELSQPSLETLTIIAYRGPIAKLDLERIRGVNCSLILRNLLLRGLIEEKMNKQKNENFYSVTLDFIKYLGISNITELPDYQKLHTEETIDAVLAKPLEMPV